MAAFARLALVTVMVCMAVHSMLLVVTARVLGGESGEQG